MVTTPEKRSAGRPRRIKIDDTPETKPDTAAIEAALMRQMDALIDIKRVSSLTTLSPREIARRVSDGRFPKPKSLGAMRKAWNISTIEQWIQQPVI